MISKKKRDAKFIIYQSLYIIVIALIALSGATLIDLNQDPPFELRDNEMPIDSSRFVALAKPGKDSAYVAIDKVRQEIIDSDELDRLRKKAGEPKKVVSQPRGNPVPEPKYK